MITILHGDFTSKIDEPSKPKQKRIGNTIFYSNPVCIVGNYSIGGDKESRGPIKDYLHKHRSSEGVSSKTFERDEYEMLYETDLSAIKSANLKPEEIDIYLSGDLLNQITTSSFVARDLKIPYYGIYSACSTMTQALSVGAMMIDGGFSKNALCSTVSHFATAERQYRYPLEYG
ncbi:MAG: hypothetical protein IKC64_03790, partial [Clostridia bacterium]|nr:hypothetical protein [Clostridia bacterium]